MKNIFQEKIKDFEIPLPSQEEQKKICVILNAIFKITQSVRKQFLNVEHLNKTLRNHFFHFFIK